MVLSAQGPRCPSGLAVLVPQPLPTPHSPLARLPKAVCEQQGGERARPRPCAPRRAALRPLPDPLGPHGGAQGSAPAARTQGRVLIRPRPPRAGCPVPSRERLALGPPPRGSPFLLAWTPAFPRPRGLRSLLAASLTAVPEFRRATRSANLPEASVEASRNNAVGTSSVATSANRGARGGALRALPCPGGGAHGHGLPVSGATRWAPPEGHGWGPARGSTAGFTGGTACKFETLPGAGADRASQGSVGTLEVQGHHPPSSVVAPDACPGPRPFGEGMCPQPGRSIRQGRMSQEGYRMSSQDTAAGPPWGSGGRGAAGGPGPAGPPTPAPQAWAPGPPLCGSG